jgi:uncharacterized membrane protein
VTPLESSRAAESPGPDRDTQLERAVGIVLYTGISVSSACLAIGLMLEVFGAALPSRVMLNAGLIVLLATPVGRVLASVVEYSRERDWLFVVLTIVVLLELVGSLIVAIS